MLKSLSDSKSTGHRTCWAPQSFFSGKLNNYFCDLSNKQAAASSLQPRAEISPNEWVLSLMLSANSKKLNMKNKRLMNFFEGNFGKLFIKIE